MKNDIPLKELAVLQALWTEENIDYHRIIALSEMQGTAISVNLIHKLLRKLLEKDLITIVSKEKTALTTKRCYQAVISREQYLADSLENNPAYDEACLPRLFANLCEKIQKPETREELLNVIRTEKERR